jgi:putative ATPase
MEIKVDLDLAQQASQKKAITYDRMGDNHYDVLSAFQKSIRGSDPDASIHYLARLVAAEDLQSICRRLLVIATEDIGMAYPSAVSIVKSCVDSALQLGFPEARIPLAQATLLLATAPKSNSAICAIDSALEDLYSKTVGEVPQHLKDAHYSGAEKMGRGQNYKYPHDYPNHYVQQQYLPDNIKHRQYYFPKDNKFEKGLKEYWDKIRKK